MELNRLLKDFIKSEKSAGIILGFCALLSLLLANSPMESYYTNLFHFKIFSKSIEFWINDGLMTVFFLLVGLEIEREIYIGELADIKKSLLPIIAAIGGMVVPALIHFVFNNNMPTQSGFGIPMATDIAFSLAVLSLLGKRVPLSIKIFLTALAIIDDLGAILVIALFYSKSFSAFYFMMATVLFIAMLILNRFKVYILWIYLLIGLFMWFFMYRSGIHATISGVLLAFAIPFQKGEENSISHTLQHRLHLPVAFIILPLFALANTVIKIPASVVADLCSPNSYGIIFGLAIGKPLGIVLFCLIGTGIGWCKFPEGLKKSHLIWIGFIAGIGFTMSIFITLLAFDDQQLVIASKIAVLVGSLLSGVIGYCGLKFTLRSPQ
jgi:Na+:H+ antiporter, NhaA family